MRKPYLPGLVPPEEAKKRDDALGKLEKYRGSLISVAFNVARDIALSEGRVTSTDVLHRLRADPTWGPRIANVDPRFMGPVFRRKCWRRIGYTPNGSHGRPVSIWEYSP